MGGAREIRAQLAVASSLPRDATRIPRVGLHPGFDGWRSGSGLSRQCRLKARHRAYDEEIEDAVKRAGRDGRIQRREPEAGNFGLPDPVADPRPVELEHE